MADPWLTIIGLGEDGPEGLSHASRAALEAAEIVFGGPRHLALVGAGARGRAWEVPFKIDPVLAEKGRRVVVLASGDPFWFGAGGSLSAHLTPGEWVAHPAPSTFALAAARLGWRLEETACLGLHAAPFARLRPVLADGLRAIVLIRDGAAAGQLAAWLDGAGFGESQLWVLEALGGPRERVRPATAAGFSVEGIASPVALAIEARGDGLPRASGLPDALFATDGQITKRPIRALTLSALAPRQGEFLWDLGAGSGSISVEWCLAGGRAVAVEQHGTRADNIRENAARFGIDHRLRVIEGDSAALIDSLPAPDAVFVGGGLNEALFRRIWAILRPGARLVANTVTLETEALVIALQAELGGSLMRAEIATAAPLGGLRGWQPARPVVQWSVVR